MSPRNDLNSVIFRGIGKSVTPLIFLELIDIPSFDICLPTYSTVFTPSLSFAAFSEMLNCSRRSNISSKRSQNSSCPLPNTIISSR